MGSQRLRLAYNTNGLREHDGPGAIRLLSERGNDAVELSLLEQHYDPLRGTRDQLQAIKTELLIRSYDATIRAMDYGPARVMPY